MLRPSTAVDRDRTCANVEDGLKNRALKASYCSRPRVHARFLRTRRYASAGISHYRLSVCLSVTRRYCSKMAKRKITQTTPRDMVTAQVLQFFEANSRGWATPFLLKFALKVTQPSFEHNDFDQYPNRQKCSISTKRKSTARFPTNHFFRQLSRLRRFERILIEIVVFEGGSLWTQISEKWGSPNNDCWRQKTRVPGLSRGVVCVILLLAVLTQYIACVRQTDTQTDTDRHTTTTNTRGYLAPRG